MSQKQGCWVIKQNVNQPRGPAENKEGRYMKFGKDIKGVIFDIDGVLLDSLGIWTDLGSTYVRAKDLLPEKDLPQILFSMSMEEGAAYLRKHYLPEMTEEEITDGLEGMIRDFYYDEAEAKAGVKQILDTLKQNGLRITAATSSPRGHVERALERNGLLGNIEKIFTSAEIGSSKHSPEIYDAAAEYMGLSKNEVCVVEDSLYALETAARAGYRTIGICDEKGEPDQEGLRSAAEVYVEKPEEMMTLF